MVGYRWQIMIGVYIIIYTLTTFLFSQLYGSTKVVMATTGSHWKCQSLTRPLPKTPESTDWKNIWHYWLRHNLAKFGFGKISRGGGTYAQNIRVRPFFFLKKLFTLFDEAATETADFDAQYVIRRRLARVRLFCGNGKYRSMTLTLNRSKSAILCGLQNVDPIFLENGTR